MRNKNDLSRSSGKKLSWFSREFPGTRIPVTLCQRIDLIFLVANVPMLTNSCRLHFCWLLWKLYSTKYFWWLSMGWLYFCCLPMCQLYFCWLVYPRKADSSCEDGVVKVHEVLWFHKWSLSPVKEGHALNGSVTRTLFHSFHQNGTCEKKGKG